jgi:hypothetical protein
VKLLDRLLTAIRRSDDMQTQLFAFLASGEKELSLLGGKKLNRDEARALAQELVPASIEVRAVCMMGNGAVVTAPHVSFDNWSEFFCNRLAKHHRIGWVVAKNYRDQDPHSIPVSIGRHLHVNRPTESAGPGRGEKVSDRAQTVFDEYAQALAEASGLGKLPIPLLLEIHSHHRTPYLEIATSGVSSEFASDLVERYQRSRGKYRELPEMLIEPLHEIRMTADLTKRFGSLRPAIAAQAFHFEIPREARQSDDARQIMVRALIQLTGYLLDQIPKAI